ncbi:hypothetical protein [Nonomuraea salmonea]|uniref:hypothetical protein n=1 Tax=Nonomuraea salmonea TaxID=46181 RepID=UPI0031F0E1FF
MRTSPGAAYDLGHHVVRARVPPPGPWRSGERPPSRSCTAGAVPAEKVQRYFETRDERPSKGGGRA